jgi:hypothetical protein
VSDLSSVSAGFESVGSPPMLNEIVRGVPQAYQASGGIVFIIRPNSSYI